MKNKIQIFLCFIILLQTNLYAQSLTYSGTDAFKIANANFVDATTIFSFENAPSGMAFGDSGTKFYTTGTGGDVIIQHNLTVAYDLSTIDDIDAFFDVSGQETAPQDIVFNSSGSKMYIAGDTGNDITEYSLSTNWDVSSASLNGTFNFEAAVFAFDALPDPNNAQRPTGMSFNNDGLKMFIVDRNKDNVYEFDLTTAYDISTTSSVINVLDISGQELNARAVIFNNDGSEMYVLGTSGDDVNIYTFSPGNEYDLSNATFSSTYSVSAQETAPQGMLFNNLGTKFYIIGSNGDDVNEYTLSTNFDFTSTVTHLDSYPIQSFEIAPQDILFNNDGTKMYVVGDSQNRVVQSSLSVPYDVSTATLDIAYNVLESQPRGMTFNNDGLKFYIVDASQDEVSEYSLSIAYDLTSTVTNLGVYDISSDDDNPTSIAFNDDGTLLFILGNQTMSSVNDVIVYTLTPGYDLSDISSGPTGRFSVNAQDSSPLGMSFNNDGTSLFVIGNGGNDINEYSLNTAYDLLTVTPTFVQNISIAAQDDLPSGIAFNASGSKFFISGNRGNDINEYFTLKYNEVSASNNGSIDNTSPLIITLTGDTFFASSGVFTDSEVIIDNVPEGLTAVLTLNSNTEAELTFTGKANSHLNSDELAANLVFTFTDAAFTSSNAAEVLGAVGYGDVLDFDYVECADNEIVYDGSWSGGNNSGVPDDSIIDLAKGIRVEDNITITANTNCDCLQVEDGQTLTISDGVELTVANSLELEGDIRLLGNAQLIQTHTGEKNISGSGNLYKDVKGSLSNVYQSGYWTSPVTTDGLTYTIASVLKDGTTPLTATGNPADIDFITGFDGETSTPIKLSTRWLNKLVNSDNWTRIDEDTELNPGEGFNKKSTGNPAGQNYTFVGKPNGGQYQYTISPFGSGIYSLYGNPYASPIDADAFIFDNATTAGSILGALHFYEAGIDFSHVTSEYTGGYATRTSGIGTPAPELIGVGPGGRTPGQNIAVGQAFFVEASASGGTVTFNNNQRSFDASTQFFGKTNRVAKKQATSFPVLRIGFEFPFANTTYHRQVAVAFRGLTDAYENGFEGQMLDYKATDMALKIKNRDLPYAIVGIEDFNNSLTIPLQVNTDADRDVSFMIDENLSLNSNIYLYDSLTDNYYNITTQDAIINLSTGSYNDRFFITFKAPVLSTQKPELAKVNILNKKETLLISSKDILNQVVIYNMLGQNIATVTNSSKETEIKVNTADLKKGIYIVKIHSNKGSLTKKIILK